MKMILRLFAVVLCALGAARAEDQFTNLFNGRDLTGWVNINCAPDTFFATNGVIYCTGTPTGILRSERMYQNFILELEWRHLKAKGNAGVYIWSDPIPARGQPFTRAIEVQVLDGQEGSWFTSDGDIFPIHGAKMSPENGRGGDRAFPTEKRMKPSPEWNHYRIECIDGDISLAVNGKVVTRGHNASPRKGFLGLESEGSPVEFRNLRLQELPARESLPPEQIVEVAAGFRPLYNGVNLRGWEVPAGLEKHWFAKDWVLEHDGGHEPGMVHLWTEKEYGDFVLVTDWRWSDKPKTNSLPVIAPDGTRSKHDDGLQQMQDVLDAGDSGIFLRGAHAAQVNMWCNPVGSGDLYGYHDDISMFPEVRKAAMPKAKADRPIGEWNRFIITMRGNRVTVVLNGQTVVENAFLPGVPARGRIGLQHHTGALQFSNLLIRELD
jgi:hypothetical protein